jgi:arylsulfatase A-like enzyme
MMTGLLPHQNGVLGQIARGWDMDRDLQPLPQRLRDAGYTTHLLGLCHETQDPEWAGYQTVEGQDAINADHVDAVVEEYADEEDPFFLSIGMDAVHRAYPSEYDESVAERIDLPPYLPDTEEARIDMARFAEFIRRTDARMAGILDALDANGVAEDTFVVFTTDHGAAIPRAKKTMKDSGLGIATLMRWPGEIDAGTVRDDLLSNVDYTPTILDLVGVDYDPEDFWGRSFAPLITGDGIDDYEPREAVVAENTYGVTYDPMRAIRTEDHNYILHFEPGEPITVIPLSVKLYGEAVAEEWYGAPIPEEQLYDLREDPHERRNLAADPAHGAVRRRLRGELLSVLRETDDPLLDGPVPDPSGEHTPMDTFDTMWKRDEDGLFRIDMPDVWQDVVPGSRDE